MISDIKELKGKRVVVMGLGLLGRGIGDVAYLAKLGTKVLVTDIKTEAQLAPALKQLAKYRTIEYVLGSHRVRDFQTADVVIKAASVPLDSPYIAAAKKAKVPVYMTTALFAALTPATTIGITGTRGKSTTTQLIYEILKAAGKRVHLGGNVRGVTTLPLLDKARSGDYAVLELDSWQLQGFGDLKISPQLSVFTTFMDDHLNYYKGNRERYFLDKANIYRYQKKGDTLVTTLGVLPLIRKRHFVSVGKIVTAKPQLVPKAWKLKIPGEHNRLNAACAVAIAQQLGISKAVIKKVVTNFSGLPGRLNYLRTWKGVAMYNDNNATTPDATIAALNAFPAKRVVLICGGTTKNLDTTRLVRELKRRAKAVILLSGSGTDEIKNEVLRKIPTSSEHERLEDCFKGALKLARKGDVLVFSPGFTSYSKYFANEYERNDLFVKLVKKLK
ncbi:MAG: UDP-N-acetylmuramoyl-L-alanine--D-glutamate ligase [Candidatus Buchananbacteria bacterium]|nr:UDP-N-acetylmuramoyl-L-alanine--D-glutamate ligase [Candidatus Buchananbacteria bacterium]